MNYPDWMDIGLSLISTSNVAALQSLVQTILCVSRLDWLYFTVWQMARNKNKIKRKVMRLQCRRPSSYRFSIAQVGHWKNISEEKTIDSSTRHCCVYPPCCFRVLASYVLYHALSPSLTRDSCLPILFINLLWEISQGPTRGCSTRQWPVTSSLIRHLSDVG